MRGDISGHGHRRSTPANGPCGGIPPKLDHAATCIKIPLVIVIVKGLHRSPRIVTDAHAMNRPGIFTAADISCLVIPDGCLGLPTLAALEQGIPMIAVHENFNLMKNDLSALPWAPGQFHQVDNYWEVVGVIAAMRAGIDPASVRRPLAKTFVSKFAVSRPEQESEDLRPAIRMGARIASVVG